MRTLICGALAYDTVMVLLGDERLPMATVGHDFGPYETWMQGCGLSLKHVARVESEFTAQAYITTDLDANQITAFHPGAMNHSHANRVPADGSIQCGVISSDGRERMLQHAAQFAAAGIPFLFDPGQPGVRMGNTGRIAALMGAIKIAHQGTQTHRFTRAEFAERFYRHFDYRLSPEGYSQEGIS
jgi:sugar/nucleoside kinase (ribokinase family)